MKATKKKRKPARFVKQLWEVEVRHRDYVATVNSRTEEVYMMNTTLFITVPQRPIEQPDIDHALARARRFLNRNQREYSIPNIQRIRHMGALDEVS